MNKHSRPRRFVGIFAMVIVGIFVFGAIVMLLWNALMPDIFHLTRIGYWQALGLFALGKILFSSFRGRPGERWRGAALREKWANMTPEERQRLKEEMSRRCGRPFPSEERFDRGNPAGNAGNQPASGNSGSSATQP